MSNQYTTSNPKCEKLIDRLIISGQKTKEFFLKIDGDAWYEQVYSEGANWSIHHLLAHFVAAEVSVTRLLKMILQGYDGVPTDFDIDDFNEREVNCLAKLPNDMVLERFLQRRGETIQFVMELNDADLVKKGRHPWLGVAPIEEMIKLMYRHNQIHQRDIRRILDS